MKSNHKRPKVATTISDEQKDRLSSLPDSILCHILSFVPTKYAAMTSVLSTRWKNLFLGVPNIDLDDSLVLKPQDDQVDNCHFENFVNRRLMLCTTSSITEFRLKCRRLLKAHVFNLWLTALFSRNVKVLVVEEFSDSSPLWIPSGIFRLETLVTLKLCGENMVLKMPESVSYPNLKVLHVRYLDMQFDSDNVSLAEGFPLLEDLTFYLVRFREKKENRVLRISVNTLKRLEIINMESYFSRIDIDTPHLQHLEYAFDYWYAPEMQINLCVCKSLVSANISVESEYFEDEGQWFIELLSKLNNVKELYLSESSTEVLSNCADSLPQFPNLTHLELFACEKSMWNLLQHMPNLKVLVCNNLIVDGSGENCFPGENEPLCFFQTLREFTMKQFGFGQFTGEIGVLRYFLQHGAVLERVIIKHWCHHKDWEWPSKTLKELLKLKRCSPRCEIELP